IQYLYELKSMPEKIQMILNSSDYINKLTNKVLASKYVCFIGRSFDYCSAMEGALKLKEVSYIPCESYAAGELKHGTISLISNDSLIIGIKCCNEIKSKTMNNIDECKARGAEILLISTENGDITVPQTNDIFYPLLEAVPLQLLAYYTAKKKGCEIDKPRNLAKSVTVE
ncbi:MAG: SIS domain-containing protein, partial [Ruminococcus sp.]|nr:SIS domain-containing protein [Candidatus Copronaster equi]